MFYLSNQNKCINEQLHDYYWGTWEKEAIIFQVSDLENKNCRILIPFIFLSTDVCVRVFVQVCVCVCVECRCEEMKGASVVCV